MSYYEEHREERIAYQKKYRKAHQEECREGARRYHETHKEVRREYDELHREGRHAEHKRWCKKYPERVKAQSAVNRALLRGELTRPEKCSECHDEGLIEGHHEDYNKPLEVVWLCHKCHLKVHWK